jgi:hypothetical protein
VVKPVDVLELLVRLRLSLTAVRGWSTEQTGFTDTAVTPTLYSPTRSAARVTGLN